MVVAEMENTTRDDDTCENLGLGCALEMFTEVDTVIGLIDNLEVIYDSSESELERQYDKLYTILKQYYEQPHLLDPHLDKILNKFVTILRSESIPDKLKHATFNYMYQIIRVRGYKVVIRHLPHEIADLQPVLTFLEAQNPEDRETWRSRFVVLLWLSIIVIMPFHMGRLDSFTTGEKGSDGKVRETVMSRIFEICKTYALVTDSCSEASAFLASKFLTRSDVKEPYLGVFLEWSYLQNSNLQIEDNIKYGVLATVAAILKHGKREDLLPYADNLLLWVTKQNYRQNKAILVRKYAVKIIQRIGLTYLKSRVAKWRYSRGSRTLAVNLRAAGDMTIPAAEANINAAEPEPEDEDDEDCQYIPEQIEEVIEQLFLGLRDGDNIVRWSAAKGLGRVSSRLGESAAGDVAAGLMDLFGPREDCSAWHGGCLALAELGRRGLLLPDSLPSAVEVILKALQYEELRGHTAVGQHVRDAACYVSWAFARAYDADILQPHVKRIAAGLIITAVFDREINCRRAASAAFQENVGRQGSFPHGIDILTVADFISVGLRNNAFLTIAPWIAQFSDYTFPLIDHLVEKKVDHWDITIRELTSKALHKLTDKAPDYMAEKVLPKLIEMTNSIDLNARHGSILAIGEVIHALSVITLPDCNKASSLITSDVLEAIRNLVPKLHLKYQFRGLGGELMRQACCACIENISMAKTNYHGDAIIDDWLTLIEECLAHKVLIIREKAIAALSALFSEYLRHAPSSHSQNGSSMKNGDSTNMDIDQSEDFMQIRDKRMALIVKYCEKLKQMDAHCRMGHAVAIGALPGFVLEESLPLVIQSLIVCTQISEPTLKWAESRRDAVKGLTNVCQNVGVQKIETAMRQADRKGVHKVFDCLIDCLSEYTVDMRGDVGAWVREASMAGLLSLCKQCANEDQSVLNSDLVSRVMLGVAQQSVQKIDRTRAHGGKVFTNLLYCEPTIPHIPHHTELLEIFPRPVKENTNPEDVTVSNNTGLSFNEMSSSNASTLWLFAEHTMPLFVKLLDWEAYRYNILLGLTVSVGDMTENLIKHSTSALFSYLTSIQEDTVKVVDICDTIIQVFADNHGNSRITLPMLNFLDRLLSSGCVSSVLEDPSSNFASEILKHVKFEIKGCKNVYKLLDSINVLCQLLQVGGNVCKSSLVKLAICICYADKYVRKSTASRLYDALLIYGEMTCIPPDNLDQVMSILAETNWELNIVVLKPIRNTLCDLMEIEKPVSVAKPASSTQNNVQ